MKSIVAISIGFAIGFVVCWIFCNKIVQRGIDDGKITINKEE